MKKFLTRLAFVFLLSYGLLYLLQFCIDRRLQSSQDFVYADWNRLFAGAINDPMVFLGNSRAEVHFDPILIEKYTGLSSYNLGMSGASLSIEQIRWKSYLEHNRKPRYVVQNIDLFALSDKEVPDKAQFLPYYRYPEMTEMLKRVDSMVWIEKLVPMSKYRGYESLVFRTLSGKLPSNQQAKKIKGYQAHREKWNQDFDKMVRALPKGKLRYSETAINAQWKELDSILGDCKAMKAHLFLVWAPQYKELTKLQQPTFSKVKSRIKKWADQNKEWVTFYDFTASPLNEDRRYFYNAFHMNADGVDVFCKQLSDSLNTYRRNANL